METAHVERVARQLTIDAIEEAFDDGGVHYLIGCYRSSTGYFVVSCACGWRIDTGKSAGNAHALMRSHVAGHRDNPNRNDSV